MDTNLFRYQSPLLLRNGHLATIYPALTRKTKPLIPYERERFETSDNDFLDVDWLKSGNEKVVIISHGLEGNSDRPYVLGMANAFFAHGYDVLAWNYRGCSEEINHQKTMYHSGATDDLDFIVSLAERRYGNVILIGFSLGGNLTLKYLGERKSRKSIKKAVTFSVPLDLHQGALNLKNAKNFVYERRFLRSLESKLIKKHEQYPEEIALERFSEVKHIIDFDDIFTGPIHGFENAEDYYKKCSSKFFLDGIEVPTLVVNAKNDPLLPPACLDSSLFKNNRQLTFLSPSHGGHCGFAAFNVEKRYWSEEIALRFCQT